MALKKQDKADIEEYFGKGPDTRILITILSLLPQLLEKVLEIIRVWKEHQAKVKEDKSA